MSHSEKRLTAPECIYCKLSCLGLQQSNGRKPSLNLTKI